MQRVLASHIRISNSRRAPPPSTRRGGACGACGPPAWRARAADSRLLVRVESSRGGADGVSLGTRRWLATGPMHFVPAACCACAPRAVPVAWCGRGGAGTHGPVRARFTVAHSIQIFALSILSLNAFTDLVRTAAQRQRPRALCGPSDTKRKPTPCRAAGLGRRAAGSSGARATRL